MSLLRSSSQYWGKEAFSVDVRRRRSAFGNIENFLWERRRLIERKVQKVNTKSIGVAALA